jgi:DNA-binding response OmpR family regulator
MRVLVADGDKTFRDSVTRSIAHELPGCAVEAVSDGAAALAAFDRHWPSLAIIDDGLPGLGALALTTALRQRAAPHELAILIATSSCSAADWQALADVGAQACLLKTIGVGLFAVLAARLMARGR